MLRKKKEKLRDGKWHENKKAFDQIMTQVRRLGVVRLSPPSAVGVGGGAGAQYDPSKCFRITDDLDFICDVMQSVKRVKPKDISLAQFIAAYWFDITDDYIEQELHAQKVIRDRRHSVEQRVGAEFIRVGLFPPRRRKK